MQLTNNLFFLFCYVLTISIMIRLRGRRPESESSIPRKENILSSSPRPHWLWGPPSLLSSGNRPQGSNGRGVKTTHFCPVLRLWMRGAIKLKTKLRGLQSASELYRPSDRHLSAKLVPTFADRGSRVVSATDPPALIRFSWPEPLLFHSSSSACSYRPI
jgi:hypothetical protein